MNVYGNPPLTYIQTEEGDDYIAIRHIKRFNVISNGDSHSVWAFVEPIGAHRIGTFKTKLEAHREVKDILNAASLSWLST